jgi:predicted TPR repeat methyltransferase
MADDDSTGFLGSVYKAASPGELARHYDAWASSYEADMAMAGYRHPAIVVALLARHLPAGAGPILDAGCGTGLVGEWLTVLGWPDIRGLDISAGMIAAARTKGVYSGLTEAALGTPLPFADGQFAAVISAGVFTTGHVGAEGLDELIRATRSGGVIILTVKEPLWQDAIAPVIDALSASGQLTIIGGVPPYISMPNEPLASPTRAVVLRRA